MRKIYSLLSIFIFCSLLAGCSKDFLKKYDDRIEGGVWRLVDVDRLGWGGSTGNLPFRDGQFVFLDDGRLEYTNSLGEIYQGNWDIRRDWVRGQCYTDEDGRYECDDRYVRSLRITAVNFTTQDIRSEFFDEIIFTGTNRFKAYIYTGTRSYVFRFRR
jgi:hypothetical protein